MPSGISLQNYGKSQFLMGQLLFSMSVFKIYVKLPEGRTITCSNIVVHKSNERERERERETISAMISPPAGAVAVLLRPLSPGTDNRPR